MTALKAYLQLHHIAERRGGSRRNLQLVAFASGFHETSNAVIRNLSQTGLLIESETVLQTGDRIEVELPRAGPCPAKVIWQKANLAGCQFVTPISQSAVSASLLLSPFSAPPHTDEKADYLSHADASGQRQSLATGDGLVLLSLSGLGLTVLVLLLTLIFSPSLT